MGFDIFENQENETVNWHRPRSFYEERRLFDETNGVFLGRTFVADTVAILYQSGEDDANDYKYFLPITFFY
jgi:hypothetical protein